MLEKPPAHRVDAPIIYIHPSDSAWDFSRYDDEKAQLEDPGKHPLSLYFGGWTRYDLSAASELNGQLVTPQDYLLPNKEPTKWYLKRLGHEDYYEVRSMAMSAWQKDQLPSQAYLKAAQIGIKKVENFPEELVGPPGALTKRDMEKLFEYRTASFDLVIDIGSAVYAASMPLTDAEKKQ